MDLAEYTRNSDRNKFWELPSGVAQNLLDEAIDRIAELEAQLTAAQERNTALQSEHLDHVIALHDQLTAMTAERDGETRWAKQYSDEADGLRKQLTAAQEREAQLNFSNATITELRGQLEKMAAERDSLRQQLTAAQEREAAYRNALMDAAKDFDRADMGNCCQHVMDELNRIINAAEAADDHK